MAAKPNIPRGSSKSEPLPPSVLSARTILRDLAGVLGKKFNPKARYSLMNKRHDETSIGSKLTDGWVIVLDDVPGDGNSDVFTLMCKVEE